MSSPGAPPRNPLRSQLRILRYVGFGSLLVSLAALAFPLGSVAGIALSILGTGGLVVLIAGFFVGSSVRSVDRQLALLARGERLVHWRATARRGIGTSRRSGSGWRE